jgi:hypothetical protein
VDERRSRILKGNLDLGDERRIKEDPGLEDETQNERGIRYSKPFV